MNIYIQISLSFILPGNSKFSVHGHQQQQQQSSNKKSNNNNKEQFEDLSSRDASRKGLAGVRNMEYNDEEDFAMQQQQLRRQQQQRQQQQQQHKDTTQADRTHAIIHDYVSSPQCRVVLALI